MSLQSRYAALDNALKSFFTGDFDVATEATDLVDEMTPEQVEGFLEQARAAATDPAPDDEVERFVDDAVPWDLGTGRQTLLELARHVEAARDAEPSTHGGTARSSDGPPEHDRIAYADVADHLVEHVPEFRSGVDEHLEYYDELLPHVLFGDLTHLVLRAREEGNDDLVRRALAFMDEALRRGDSDVENLVQVSFVENVGPWEPEHADFIEQWPPALRAEASRRRSG